MRIRFEDSVQKNQAETQVKVEKQEQVKQEKPKEEKKKGKNDNRK
jgi:hypothetical protein